MEHKCMIKNLIRIMASIGFNKFFRMFCHRFFTNFTQIYYTSPSWKHTLTMLQIKKVIDIISLDFSIFSWLTTEFQLVIRIRVSWPVKGLDLVYLKSFDTLDLWHGAGSCPKMPFILGHIFARVGTTFSLQFLYIFGTGGPIQPQNIFTECSTG